MNNDDKNRAYFKKGKGLSIKSNDGKFNFIHLKKIYK